MREGFSLSSAPGVLRRDTEVHGEEVHAETLKRGGRGERYLIIRY